MGFTPTPAEEGRAQRFSSALAVPRAVHMAARTLDPSVTVRSIERNWLRPCAIARARALHGGFIGKMLMHERKHEGFIAQHVVLARDLHCRKVRAMLANAVALIALHDRALLMCQGECAGVCSYANAFEQLVTHCACEASR